MKKLLLILLCLPMIGFGQITMIPDWIFEFHLISLGYDTMPINGSVPTANIETITHFTYWGGSGNLTDLTGIEDFTALTQLSISGNDLTSLDLTQNTALTHLWVGSNELTSLYICCPGLLYTLSNHNLLQICYAQGCNLTNQWQHGSNTTLTACHNCGTTSIQEHTTNKQLLKVTDLLGRETKGKRNELLFYIYDDGTVEKRIVIE